ncbi:caspase family protein [Methyloceanibacter sp.]|uniref:caspase family protein n=1 Tax=Methyloceanibacter sp. TaxID=1965321 RepID=UPI003D6D357D
MTAFAPVAEPLDPAARPLNGPVIAVVTPETGAERAPPAAPTARAEAISRVQRCFAQLGYYKGPIDGKANDDTWTAHWYFKNDHGLKAYGDFLADAVQKKLRELCKEEVAAAPEPESAAEPEPATEPEPVTEPEAAQAAESEPAPAAAPEPLQATEPQTQAAEPEPLAEPMAEPDVQTNEEQVTVALAPAAEPQPAAEEEPVEPPPLARIDTDCLPEDLIGHLRAAHGDSVRARACTPGCLPSPAGLSQAQLDDLQARFGVAWCRDCVQIEGHLSLPDIWRIEGAGDFELCAMPPRHLPRPGIGNGNVAKSFTRIRELYREQTPAAEDQALIAVIIGNGTYDKLPPAETAANDAGAMYFFLTEHLGHRQDNIIDVRNARKADLERLFGPVPGSDGELARLVRAQPNAKVIVYYSGHGGTNSDHSETYLLPADAEPYREELSGYPLSTLYANLAALKAKSVLVLLESEYGRDHGAYVLPPNLPETTNSAVPQAPYTNVTVLSATDRGQRKLIDTSYDVGLFTRYLIEGLAGAADLYPVGNGDGMVDSAESFVYAAAMVRLAARKTFGLLQQPVYSSGATPVLSGAVAAKPN